MSTHRIQGLTSKTREAYRLFYPMAALLAAISIPLWVGQYLGFFDLGLSAQDHAHEMVFGFALAVMTGFLLNGVKKINLILLTLIWISARTLPYISSAPMPLVSVVQLLFPILLAILVAVPLFRNAKTWRNLAFAPILAAFILAEFLFQLGHLDYWDAGQERGLLFGLNLMCAMIFMMGGRVITAVTNGAMQALGDHLVPGKQSYWERNGFFCLITLVLGDLTGISILSIIGSLGFFIAISMRVYHWQITRLWKNPQCLWLHIGFIWLATGVLLRSIGHLLEGPFSILGIHVITIAALGTLSLTIMSRTTLQRIRSPIVLPRIILIGLGCLSAAAFFRLCMELFANKPTWGVLSAFFFSLSFSLFLVWFTPHIKKKKK